MAESKDSIDSSLDFLDFKSRFTVGLRALIPTCDGYERERGILLGKSSSGKLSGLSELDTVCRLFREEAPEQHLELLDETLELLRSVTKEIIAENDYEMEDYLIESGMVHLLKIFRSASDGFGESEKQKCGAAFGHLPPKLMRRANEQVQTIKYCVGTNFSPIVLQILGGRKKGGRKRSYAEQPAMNGSDAAKHGEGAEDSTEFGKLMQKLVHPKPSGLIDFKKYVTKEWDRLMERECLPDSEKGAGFSMKYGKHGAAMALANGASQTASTSQTSAADITDGTEKIELGYVIEELSAKFGDASDEIIHSVFSWLVSDSSNESLQNDLYDLLGVDNFTLITAILLNRLHLVKEYKTLFGQKGSKNLTGAEIRAKCKSQSKSFGQRIVIQSEREMRIEKELRKVDKRVNRLHDKRGIASSSEFDDVDVMRQKELELEAARQIPLFFQRGVVETPKYPYVFDSFTEAAKTAAFVAGTKMALPAGFTRNNNVDYEEVIIEPNVPASANLGIERKTIADMDKLIQTAFKNTKSLNVIQSVVYDKAYGSNENLLICAPTGAGKTNIAMLCILRVLKDFMIDDSLQKDKFKVVYVAPMKALAAEMVRNFGARLAPFGIKVRELTGDMQLSKAEIMQTQMLVTTPEKWDVITRKSTGDTSLALLLKLLIIDEVHLLHDDRGPVIETLVARTLRQETSSQSMIRIVGLSATLPNYVDVARFLRVNPMEGMFFFDGRFRPVPLGLNFVGIKGHNSFETNESMDKVCFEKALYFVKAGHQVMVFVHARMATGRIARTLKEIASNRHLSELFMPENTPAYGMAQRQISRSRNRQLQELFDGGFGIHHAGMLRQDRLLVERLFSEGHIRVLCCTATLAWGVNLPAHAVIIRGTEIYDAKHGSYVDIGMLDVQQIFGRAGRPQYDKVGYATILTSHDKLAYYLSMLTRQLPIESRFMDCLADNLNAEICLGTVSNVAEAVEWLSFTYMYVRMRLNPLVYGITYKQKEEDPNLHKHREDLIHAAALRLDRLRMIRIAGKETFNSVDLGRIASYYYIRCSTIEIVNDKLRPVMTDDAIFALVSQSSEFEELKVRDDEMKEMDELLIHACRLPVARGVENVSGKVNTLLQAHVTGHAVSGFSLISDTAYVVQNAGRILRAIFEVALSQNYALAAAAALRLGVAVERQAWPDENPLWQLRLLRHESMRKIEEKKLTMDHLKEMPAKEIAEMLRDDGTAIKESVSKIPALSIDISVQPMTRTVLKVNLAIVADFHWDDRAHDRGNEVFHIWLCDMEDNVIHHKELFAITKKQVVRKEVQKLTFTVPLHEPLPNQYVLQCLSDRWQGCHHIEAIPLKDLILPESYPPHTELLDLTPLPIAALDDEQLQALYPFTHYNAVQTQMFFCLYHTENNVLVGAPTGSGKTIMAELAMFRLFRTRPNAKCVYIAPMKALVQERMKDWRIRLGNMLKKRIIELTGDVTPDIQAIAGADVIVTTPEKWDGISRSWQTRGYVRDVGLIVIDEIHLLGEERGPVLEVIVSRTNFITAQTGMKVRIVGLSTALANARDLADWLNIGQMGIYNFRPSVRPVPLEVHMRGFPEKRYCPRMASMNKPLFIEITNHSPDKPVLVFVASRKQTRLTAFDLIPLLAGTENTKQYLHMPEEELENCLKRVRDSNLRTTLTFGIGMHHAGLHENDRQLVEDLFVNRKIQVLVATATLAWGVNFPAHLVVVKGTEYYDAKVKRYVDFPITDVLQMIGRAGRQQFDDRGVACVFVQDVKKPFYKKFLYEPFPVESNLLAVLADHMNAEIVAGTINTNQAAIDYLTWTFFFRRLLYNPSYYQLEGTSEQNVNQFLRNVVDQNLQTLLQSACIEIMEDNRHIQPLVLGRIASFYYLQHKTVKIFRDQLKPNSSIEELFKILTSVHEYDEIPVRHNEDQINSELAKLCPLPCEGSFDDPHTKAFLLYQAHFSRITSLNSDFQTDQKSVLDQGIRILQAMLDVCADAGWLQTTLAVASLIQMVVQGRWINDPPLSILPHMDQNRLSYIAYGNMIIETVPELKSLCLNDRDILLKVCSGVLDPNQQEDVCRVLVDLPQIDVKVSLRGWWPGCESEERLPIDLEDGQASYPVHADQQYLLCVYLHRINRKLESRAYAPKFPKIKDEGWFVMLGDVESGELVAMKRMSFMKRRITVNLVFTTPPTVGPRTYAVYLISDSYLGMDQQYQLRLDVQPASIEAQTNSELITE